MNIDFFLTISANVASIFVTAFIAHTRFSRKLEGRLTKMETSLGHMKEQLDKIPCLQPDICIRRGDT